MLRSRGRPVPSWGCPGKPEACWNSQERPAQTSLAKNAGNREQRTCMGVLPENKDSWRAFSSSLCFACESRTLFKVIKHQMKLYGYIYISPTQFLARFRGL